MKQAKAKTKRRTDENDDLRPHYDFDRSKAKPNRFATKYSADTIAVVLDPDVSAVFRDSEAVNKALRALLDAIPGVRKATRP